ncbi:MAG: hypothetical protein LBR39_03440 [Coriobacteriales bacterium]|jgi:MraZ protein|nr:hypothetical protein [Coriobacteriales bacterium]
MSELEELKELKEPFRYTTTHPMDDKGRVSLPSEYRRALPEDLLVAMAPDKGFPHLRIYSKEDYSAWVDSIFEAKGGFKANKAEHDFLKGEMFANTRKLTLDSKYRISIHPELRKYASLQDEVVIRGAGDHVQIWDAEALARYRSSFSAVSIFD